MPARSPTVRALAYIADNMLGEMASHPVAKKMHAEISRLLGQAEALDAVAVSRSPLDTESAHALKTGRKARTLDAEVTASINRVADIYRRGKEDVQRRLDERVNLKPDAFASEIRASFRTLKRAEKMKLIAELVDQNRGPELAAIVKAPSILTGLSDEERTRFGQAIAERHAASELEEALALDQVFDAAVAGHTAAGDFAKSLNDPRMLAEIERRANAADAAGDAFERSLQ